MTPTPTGAAHEEEQPAPGAQSEMEETRELLAIALDPRGPVAPDGTIRAPRDHYCGGVSFETRLPVRGTAAGVAEYVALLRRLRVVCRANGFDTFYMSGGASTPGNVVIHLKSSSAEARDALLALVAAQPPSGEDDDASALAAALALAGAAPQSPRSITDGP